MRPGEFPSLGPEPFQRLEELYHAALEATPEERATLLAGIDPETRRQVESLLSSPIAEFLDRPAIGHAPELLEDATVTEAHSGACLGPYRLEGKLGEGGMGVVFRAVDTRLGRAVAVKTTQARFSERFEREARLIASLNHPNICTLHDVGHNYLVMELVEGETIASLLKHGPLPVNTALSYASQIVAALVEAHSKGIVHRDLKPGNIMVGKSGVKVLDFGLARSGQDETVTGSHMVVGTPAYMAPEQREGKPSDARTDIYGFGCVLYEMLAGTRIGPQRRPIRPRKLDQIVGRCLEEDPRRRWQSAAELQRQLAAAQAPQRAGRMAAAAILVLGVAAYFWIPSAPKLTAKDTVILAEFENKTGDSVFDGTLRQGLVMQLQQSRFVTVASDDNIEAALRFMNRPLDTRLTPEVSREICERTGSSAVLEGSIAGLGSEYILWLRAKRCGTGNVLAEEQAEAVRKEEVLNALSRIATQIRARLGESLATIREHSKPLEQATTGSLEALKAYSAARNAAFARGHKAGIPHLQRAIEIDPEFAMAHADLGFFSSNLGQTELGAKEVEIAHRLRDRVSEREKLFILFLYHRQVTGNLQKALEALETWRQLYPRDRSMGLFSGWVALGTGQYERGIQAARQILQLFPDSSIHYGSLAYHNLLLDRYTEAEDALRQAAARNFELPQFLVHRYYLAFLRGDQAGMEREIARTSEGAQDWMSHNQALVLARSGRMGQARTMWERAIALAQQAGARETAALYMAAAAVCEAHFGNAEAAGKRARAALEMAKGRDVEYAAAFALALSGDASEPQRLAADLEKRFPEDTPVQFEYLPTLRALAALAHRAPLDAIDRLKVAVPYDFAMPGTAFHAKFGGLYTAYVRGQAYLAAGRGQEAAAEFQKVLSRRGVVLADPIGALAHLQLGRAYVVSGDKSQARSAYQSFLALWKDADQDLPVLKQAKAEYTKL